jgi:biopolymer transport protein ExbD
VIPGRLTAKMRKLREEHEEAEIEGGELNLVPFLDIVTNVIMFLLMTTTFAAALGDINVSSPTRATVSDQSEVPPDQKKQDLNLTVQISDKGYIIAASGAVLYENDVPGRLPTIPKKGSDYDYTALTAKMRAIKDNFADETRVIINANPEITYETVVAAMDAIRTDGSRELFPGVILSAGVN